MWARSSSGLPKKDFSVISDMKLVEMLTPLLTFPEDNTCEDIEMDIVENKAYMYYIYCLHVHTVCTVYTNMHMHEYNNYSIVHMHTHIRIRIMYMHNIRL